MRHSLGWRRREGLFRLCRVAGDWRAIGKFLPRASRGAGTPAAVPNATTDKPLSAGTGAFGGLISMPWPWVGVSIFVSLVVGSLFGIASVKLAGVLGGLGARQPAEEPKVAVSA